ncbi:MAG: phosphoribosylanthranilate isomerase [Candidatus Hydrogenedentes bacterium]|jgi:phosphoribosylanthranilate isomerase|nr:phosphoribosylanthranilate isomerase [Candidatus Hydrogenedentota bacterium]
MMTKVKICGITTAEDAMAAVEAGADALGFVLAEEGRKRNRYIDLDDAVTILNQLPAFITTVAVVINEPVERLQELLTVFDRIQLHGDESAELCEALGHRVYKAFRVGPHLNTETIAQWPGQMCLLDAWTEEAYGGTGTQCDWQFAKAAGAKKQIILAGGLSPENVEEAILRVQPFAVDASSSLESSPGKKNHDRIRLFIYNARKASLS